MELDLPLSPPLVEDLLVARRAKRLAILANTGRWRRKWQRGSDQDRKMPEIYVCFDILLLLHGFLTNFNIGIVLVSPALHLRLICVLVLGIGTIICLFYFILNLS
jgi:hypothetical protein